MDLTKTMVCPKCGNVAMVTDKFRFKNASAKEQEYHSLDEMPPETHPLFEKLRGRLG